MGYVLVGFALPVALGLTNLDRDMFGMPVADTLWDRSSVWYALAVVRLGLSLWLYTRKERPARLIKEDGAAQAPQVVSCKWLTPTMIDCVLKNYTAQPILLLTPTIDLYRNGAEVCAGIPLHLAGRDAPMTLAPGATIELNGPCPPFAGTDKAFIAGYVTRHRQKWTPWGTEYQLGPAPSATT